VATARLGPPAALAGKVATDFFGRYLHDYIERQGVDLRWLVAVDARSTLAFVAMESGEPVFTFYGEGAADSLLTIDDLPDALFAETQLLHVGSISLLRGTTPAAVLALCERLKGRALLSLDPNLRPGLVRDEGAYRALLRRLVGLADIVKVSAADLTWLSPGQSVEDAARELTGQGPALAVVTRGGQGVLAVRGGPEGPTTLTVAAPAVEVADTVGAGDAFTAGLLTRLSEHGVTSRAALQAVSNTWLTAALRFASAVAALNCTRPGADPPDRATVDAFLSVPNAGGDDR
jgi:fructokinase